MKYLIYLLITESGKREAFFTEWFDAENNFTPGIGMTVFDLKAGKFTTDGVLWDEITEDHL